MRKSLLFITGLLCLCLLTACGTKAEVPPETPPVVETAAPSPTPPMSEEPFAPVSGDEIAKELAEAIRQLRQPREMDISGAGLENPKMDVKNIYCGLMAQNPELKYAYDLTVSLSGTELSCKISYMPYKCGQQTEGMEISSIGELIAAAEENMGQEPTPIWISDSRLNPDDMNRALQQAGGGYVYCALNNDATAILYIAPYDMTMDDCLSALRQAGELADNILAQLITEDMTQLEKAEALYSYVTEHVSYDQRYYSDRAGMPYASQTALGALRDGLAICGGYSHAIKLLFEKAGICCYNVSGKCLSESHMWNIAQIDGEWLWFDATMDRGSTGEFGFLRFALKELDKTKYQWDEASLTVLLD